MQQAKVMRKKLSAFVITYNRASLLETCLRAVSFADELIVVDKSSTDNSVAIAARYADRVEVVPWSPTVEETRAFALSLCHHEWIMCLDDDEILSPETVLYLRANLAAENIDIYTIPYRHYILGEHDERAYYWPETRHCLFRRGAVEFIPTVHGGVSLQSDRIASVPVESGVCIHHLSYSDVAGWIERTNRYTGRPDRVRVERGRGNLIEFAHGRIDYWMQRTDDASCNEYPTAVALLRAIYDMVDRLKVWETERGVDGTAQFRIAQKNLVPAIEGREVRAGVREIDGRAPHEIRARGPDATQIPRAGEVLETAGFRGRPNDEMYMEMQALLVRLRATEAQLRERTEAERRSTLSLIQTRNELDAAGAALAGTRNELEESWATLDQTRATLYQTSTSLHQTSEALDQTSATLDQTRLTLDQTHLTLDRTRGALDQTQACLIKVTLEREQLGNSSRLFIRQYLPKLRRYLLPWLTNTNRRNV
jgi:Glycosyl transferase family 2